MPTSFHHHPIYTQTMLLSYIFEFFSHLSTSEIEEQNSIYHGEMIYTYIYIYTVHFDMCVRRFAAMYCPNTFRTGHL